MGILYLLGVWCVNFSVLSSGCVSSNWMVSSIGLSLAWTNFCIREGMQSHGVLER